MKCFGLLLLVSICMLPGCSYKIESYEAKYLMDYCVTRDGVHSLQLNPGCYTVTCNNGQKKTCVGEDT